MIIDANVNRVNQIGRLGENAARTLRFDVSGILSQWPGATFTLLNRRARDPAAYPVPREQIQLDGNALLWEVASSDLTDEGIGQCELIAGEGDVIYKTVIYQTRVEAALDGSGTPPEPWESWVQDVTDAADRAEDVLNELKATTATAETLAPGSDATASYDDGVLSIGVPRGDTGATPDLSIGTVTTGEPGTSAEVSIHGTPEEPIMELIIPRGAPGMESVLAGENISGNKYRIKIQRV